MTAANKKVGMNLTEGNILTTLLLFSAPMILANVVQQVYSVVDLMVIGKYAGSIGTVGVSVGGEISDIITPIATAFASAGQIYISQLIGAKQEEGAKETIGTLITFMLGSSVVLLLGTWICSGQILNLLNCPEEARSEALAYLLTTALGFPFICGYNAVCGILRGMGESRKPLIFVCIAAAMNVVLDLILVAGFHMGAFGTAVATVIAQMGSCVAAFLFMLRQKEQFGLEWNRRYFRMNRKILTVILIQGIPLVIQNLLIRLSLLWCNAHINSYGLVASATNSVGNKLQKLCTIFVNGVTMAAGAMAGQNLGARKIDRVWKTIWTALGCTLIFATIGAFLSLTMPRTLYGFFTNDPEVIELGVVYLRIMCITYYLAACLGSFQAIITGSGFAAFGFVIGILDGVICRIGFALLLVYVFDMGVVGFFYSNALGRLIPALICFLYFISGKWKSRKLLVS